MKIDAIRLIGSSIVDLPIAVSDASGPFVLKGAEGLGPTEVTVKLTRTNVEKSVYQGRTAAPRQVILAISLQPNWAEAQTPEELRTTLMGLLTPKHGRLVRLELMFGGVVQAYAQGQLSKFESSLFSKDPMVQVTMECDHAYFQAPADLESTPETFVHQDGTLSYFEVDYTGTAPTGFYMVIRLDSAVAGTTLYLTDGQVDGQRLQIDGVSWGAGDLLLVDTRSGALKVTKGITDSVISNVNVRKSTWLQLHPGVNRFTLNVNGISWVGSPLLPDFTHRPAYLGV